MGDCGPRPPDDSLGKDLATPIVFCALHRTAPCKNPRRVPLRSPNGPCAWVTHAPVLQDTWRSQALVGRTAQNTEHLGTHPMVDTRVRRLRTGNYGSPGPPKLMYE